MTKPSV